jgi:hypothetical protein
MPVSAEQSGGKKGFAHGGSRLAQVDAAWRERAMTESCEEARWQIKGFDD